MLMAEALALEPLNIKSLELMSLNYNTVQEQVVPERVKSGPPLVRWVSRTEPPKGVCSVDGKIAICSTKNYLTVDLGRPSTSLERAEVIFGSGC